MGRFVCWLRDHDWRVHALGFPNYRCRRCGLMIDGSRSTDWRVPLRRRIRLAWSVLRGHQRWSSGYPTPWAYEQVCDALRRERYGR